MCVDRNKNINAQANLVYNCYFDKSHVKLKKLNSLEREWNLLNSILRIAININMLQQLVLLHNGNKYSSNF